MPYRNPGSPRSFLKARPGRPITNQSLDYSYGQTGLHRHDLTGSHKNGTLAVGDYVRVNLLKFKRSFTAGTDVPDTPDSGNNYQTVSVMNGSRIINYRCKVRITNLTPTDAANTVQKSYLLDVYQVAISFHDALIWTTHDSDSGVNALITYDSNAASPNAGEVTSNSTQQLFGENEVLNSKFMQRYFKKIAQVEVGAGQSVDLNINRIPPQCRRSNSGMFWGLFIHLDSDKNSNDPMTVGVSSTIHFDEIPSEDRLPFLY